MDPRLEGMALGVQASLRIALPNLLVYIDPFKIQKSERADLILITHPHFDHLDPASIQKLYQKGCTVCVPKGSEEIYTIAAREDVKIVKPGMEFATKGLKIKTIPAYNVVPNRLHYHPRENEWVGYTISLNGRTIYHPGDTDRIAEMKQLKGKVSVAFLPIGGTYTMDAKEASGAAEDIAPEIACPMHVIPAGNIEAQQKAQEEFRRLVEAKGKTRVEIINGKGIFD